MKILAEIDISQPLIKGIPFKHNGVEVWAEFKYKKCPDFCYRCGVIGHGDKACNFEERIGITLRRDQQGTWHKAGNIMANP